MSETGQTTKRIAIIGGGVAGLAAAFELSDPRHEGKFEVSLYQLGWRLGGKCASGRDLDVAKRIKEHGPHIFFGFYDNGFAVLREAYETLSTDASRPFQSLDNALEEVEAFVAMDQRSNGSWTPWTISLPKRAGFPGDPLENSEWFSLMSFHEVIERRVMSLAESNPALVREDVVRELAIARSLVERLRNQQEPELRSMTRDLAKHYEKLQHYVRKRWAEQQLHPRPDQPRSDHLQLAMLTSLLDTVRRNVIMADLGLAMAAGMLMDDLIWPTAHSVAAANQLDFRAWLAKHGALEITVESAIIRAIYDTVFAYPGGDVTEDGDLAAGSAALACKGIVSYRGAPAYKMRAGTGDVVAAPIYEVLRQRKVPVHFFHRLSEMTSADGTTIDSVTFGVQATIVDGKPYAPLIKLSSGLQAWPDRPIYAQLDQGGDLESQGVNLESDWSDWADVATSTINAGTDFEAIILATPLEALRDALPVALPQAWVDALSASRTVPTASVQLWLDKSVAQSGWSGPGEPIASAFDVGQLDTWLDATSVIKFEEWQNPAPAQMAILCGPLRLTQGIPPPGPSTFPDDVSNATLAFAQSFLDNDAGTLWPNLVQASGFDWAALTSRSNKAGADRLSDQVWVGAVNASDRYVLTPSGDATAARLAPDQSGYANLFLSGDWTDYGYNLGFFEGAVISGLMAANAVSGDPRPILRNPFGNGNAQP